MQWKYITSSCVSPSHPNCLIFIPKATMNSVPSKNSPLNPNEGTPVKTETIYRPLPVPESSQTVNDTTIKALAAPHKPIDIGITEPQSDETETPPISISSQCSFSFPRVHPSPTKNDIRSELQNVLSEVNTPSKATRGSASNQPQNTVDENADPSRSPGVANLTELFSASLRISPSVGVPVQRRCIFDGESDGETVSCLFSPPSSPKPSNRHQVKNKWRAHRRSPKTAPVQPERSTALSPPVAVTATSNEVGEVDGNLCLQYLLEEKKRLEAKLAYIKVS